MSDLIIPDMTWYLAQHRDPSLPPRCPYASIRRCPPYYQSLGLLANAGFTGIDPEQDAELCEHWRKSDLWPATREQETSIMGSNGSVTMYTNFCPEVAFDSFGYFASFLSTYADDLDRDLAHERLAGNALPNDWRWAWSAVAPTHYTHCPLFSSLHVAAPDSEAAAPISSRDIIELKPNAWGFGFDLKELLRRLKRRIRIKRKRAN